MAKIVKNQYVVIGLGRFGIALTKSLFAEGAEVLVIDRDAEKINDIEPYCTQAVCADASDERVLAKLGVRNLDVAVVCITNDIESSIFVTLLLKQLGIPKIIAKAQDDKHKHVLEKIGADYVIVSEEEMGIKLAASLVKPNMIEILSLSNQFRIVEIRTPDKWQGKSLLELNLRTTERISIILIKRGDTVLAPPTAECVLLPDDILVIAGAVADIKRLSNKATAKVLED